MPMKKVVENRLRALILICRQLREDKASLLIDLAFEQSLTARLNKEYEKSLLETESLKAALAQAQVVQVVADQPKKKKSRAKKPAEVTK